MHVETHGCCIKFFRMMRFQPRGLISQNSISRRMALVETIACKFVDQVEQLICTVWWNRVCCAATDKPLALRIHFRLDFFAHRAAKQIGFTQTIASKNLRCLHNLFLIDKYPICLMEHRLKQRVGILNGFLPIFAAAKHWNIIHRPGPVE